MSNRGSFFPTVTSRLIPSDVFARTWMELDHWYKLKGSSLYQRCCELFGNETEAKKEALLYLARSGGDKPSRSSSSYLKQLAQALTLYTNKGGPGYDSDFNKQIRKANPRWFEDSAEIKKKQLLALAHKGASRPAATTKLGSALCSYVYKTHNCFDPAFAAAIKKANPRWFEDGNGLRKKTLLKMAVSGAKRPLCTYKNRQEMLIGRSLVNYTNVNSNTYDQKFDRQIRQMRPDWFEDRVASKKRMLINMAARMDRRPSKESKDPGEALLGRALSSYTCKVHGAYDAVFDKEIRRANPSWFTRR